VGVEGRGDDGLRVASSFVAAEARFVGEVASGRESELAVSEQDMAALGEVRGRRRFHRDRAPAACEPPTTPEDRAAHGPAAVPTRKQRRPPAINSSATHPVRADRAVPAHAGEPEGEGA
jgi:hypothetical protein